jgi:hypothetical protein
MKCFNFYHFVPLFLQLGLPSIVDWWVGGSWGMEGESVNNGLKAFLPSDQSPMNGGTALLLC